MTKAKGTSKSRVMRGFSKYPKLARDWAMVRMRGSPILDKEATTCSTRTMEFAIRCLRRCHLADKGSPREPLRWIQLPYIGSGFQLRFPRQTRIPSIKYTRPGWYCYLLPKVAHQSVGYHGLRQYPSPLCGSVYIAYRN